ncbi:MAG: aminotransferase class I/II-fold pyridoxal phosphate-dependent enzyme [Rhodospirillales bacterium]|nr:aminotransferase class I/II-fold pyridoxal phosphate-dependent enzyme [Rhodospirillales bacterium]
MTIKVSRRGGISPFIVMDVMRAANARAAEGCDVLHLEVGQPSTPAPRGVLEAAKKILDADLLGYTDALGVPQLRQRISAHYKSFYGLEVDAGRIAITAGSSGAFILAFLSAFDEGDLVGLALPGYPAYKNILQALGLRVAEIPVDGSTRFQPTAEILDRLAEPLDGLIVASPSNPTGSMLPPESFKDLCDWCHDHDVRLVSDEIYHGITYGQGPLSALSMNSEAIVVNSFSKYFSMTGWRLGWLVLPEDLERSIECLAQNIFISPPTLSQLAAISVFDCFDELDANVERYALNREILLTELPKAGFTDLAPPDGAFYIYANIEHMTDDSRQFCQHMLMETGVAATPGVDFDPARGHRFMRFSYAGSSDEMAQVADRLKSWLR